MSRMEKAKATKQIKNFKLEEKKIKDSSRYVLEIKGRIGDNTQSWREIFLYLCCNFFNI